MDRANNPVTRRAALGLLAGAASALTGCGGAESGPAATGGAAGAGGTGQTGGTGGAGGTAGASGGGGAAGSPATGGAAGGTGLACKRAPTPGCKITEDNILGPYYKPGAPLRSDITDGESGQALVVSGTVFGCDCVTPLAGAIVDVWQANDAGEYDNVGYVLRGQVTTDAEGRYEITTILPGFYLNGASYRPRHIHYKVSHLDGVALTTQLYFEGDPNIPTDAFVKPSLVMPLSQEPDGAGGTRLRCVFDVVLA